MADAIEIWLLDPAVLSAEPVRSCALSLLSQDEHARARRFVFPRDCDTYVAAHALARTVIGRYADSDPRALVFGAGPYGKPSLTHPLLARGLAFNISHTRGLAACAVAWDRSIGVDVEEVRDAPLELVDSHFALPEAVAIRALRPSDQGDAFYAVWTLKESYIKAIGLGLSMPLDRFAVAWSPPRLLAYGDAIDTAADWHVVRLAPTPTTRLALCVSLDGKAPPAVHTRWLSSDDLLRAADHA